MPMRSGITMIEPKPAMARRSRALTLALSLGFAAAAPATVADELEVVVPALPPAAKVGKADYQIHCAACHGPNAAGTEQGPTFLHRIYHPGHHADFSFVLAVTRGVRQHHWRFGNMKPLPEVDKAAIDRIVGYIRELQQANGVF